MATTATTQQHSGPDLSLTTDSSPTANLEGSASALTAPVTTQMQSKTTPTRVFDPEIRRAPVKTQQQYLIDLLHTQMNLSEEQTERVRKLVLASDWLSFGNPKVSRPSMSQQECFERRKAARLYAPDPSCGAPNMVVAHKPNGERQTTSCIDQYEFPNVECEYPVVWVRSSEAANLCAAVGKRLCDAHEWEGACAGEVLSEQTEYPLKRMPKAIAHSGTRERRLWLEYEHNRTRDVRWAYGDQVNHELCATGARKDSKCNVVDFSTCSSSTYPAGSFPECVSPLGVYDQHGNAAEHMNLALQPSELTSHGGLGWTEMKGSWFIFTHEQSHPDDCRWRAKSWHTTRVGDWNSHRNYHLGFRCCKDVSTSGLEPQAGKATPKPNPTN